MSVLASVIEFVGALLQSPPGAHMWFGVLGLQAIALRMDAHRGELSVKWLIRFGLWMSDLGEGPRKQGLTLGWVFSGSRVSFMIVYPSNSSL